MTVETTGRIAALVRPGGHDGWLPGVDPSSEAPARASIHEAALRRACPVSSPGSVAWLGNVCYVVGGMHPTRSFERYVYRAR